MKTETQIKVLAKSYIKSKKYGNTSGTLADMEEDIQYLLDKIEHEDPVKFDKVILDLQKMGYWE